MLKIALVKNSMDPKSDLGMARCSRPAKKMGLEVAGLAMRVVLISCSVPSWLFSLAPTLWAVEKPDPWESCRLLEPLPARGARRAPGQKPTHSKPSKSELEPKASTSLTPSKTIKNDHPKSEPTRGPLKKRSKTCFSPLAQSQSHRQPPNCSYEADHSHGSAKQQRAKPTTRPRTPEHPKPHDPRTQEPRT